MNEVERRLGIHALGNRAIQYYVDTGLCVFCEADDCADVPHDGECDVGELAGITTVTPERKAAKVRERGLVDEFIAKQLAGI